MSELKNLLIEGWPALSESALAGIVRFQELLAEENTHQNLTRLITPKDFYEGHVLDVKSLLKSGLVDYPALDLGSGCGVPGILCALVDPKPWVLVESEKKKAEFLVQACQKLGLAHVKVAAVRGEAYLAHSSVRSVVARAVGPVQRIYSWIRDCSTWNNLVLLKGPGWTDEWKAFESGRGRTELRQVAHYEYTVGDVSKRRIIVRLERVPRGT